MFTFYIQTKWFLLVHYKQFLILPLVYRNQAWKHSPVCAAHLQEEIIDDWRHKRKFASENLTHRETGLIKCFSPAAMIKWSLGRLSCKSFGIFWHLSLGSESIQHKVFFFIISLTRQRGRVHGAKMHESLTLLWEPRPPQQNLAAVCAVLCIVRWETAHSGTSPFSYCLSH